VPENDPTEIVIPKQGNIHFNNFNLEGEVRFEFNLDHSLENEFDESVMHWA
jgi:hypothetical protein